MNKVNSEFLVKPILILSSLNSYPESILFHHFGFVLEKPLLLLFFPTLPCYCEQIHACFSVHFPKVQCRWFIVRYHFEESILSVESRFFQSFYGSFCYRLLEFSNVFVESSFLYQYNAEFPSFLKMLSMPYS